MNTKIKITVGSPLALGLSLALFILNCGGYANLPWYIVLSPILIEFVISIILLFLLLSHNR